jgi:hypothetical protein
MKWYKKFKVNMPSLLSEVCTQYTKDYATEPQYAYKSTENSDMWIMWQESGHTLPLKSITDLTQDITGLNLDYDLGFVVIWRYDDKFPKCPIHIDDGRGNGGKHNGSVCTAINGSFKIHYHDENNNIIDSVDVNDKTLICLNNTRFPHSVEGKGDLIVFGVDLLTEPEVYWHD